MSEQTTITNHDDRRPVHVDADGWRDFTDAEVDRATLPGQCCECLYAGERETPCPYRLDKTHCVHWWDGPDESAHPVPRRRAKKRKKRTRFVRAAGAKDAELADLRAKIKAARLALGEDPDEL